MKKKLFVSMLVALALVLLTCGAFAQSYNFSSISAKLQIPGDTYVLITPDNLNIHSEWIARQGTTEDELRALWEETGLLVLAENRSGDVQILVTAVQDDDAKAYYDLDQQSEKTRTAWRTAHLKGSKYSDLGYSYTSAEWKKKDQYGRVLLLKYKYNHNNESYRGIQYKLIRNGYTICFDYRIYDRATKTTDQKALDAIMNTFVFTHIGEKPAECASRAIFTAVPPSETSTGKFTVEGTCDTGLKLTGVVMKMSSSQPLIFEAEPNAKGKFSMDIQLPEEGVWLMTVTVTSGNTVTQEEIFNTTTYQKTLLPINFDSDYTLDIKSDTLTISGVTMKGVRVQCMVVGTKYDKNITTNGTGKFSFKIDTKNEGDYSIVVVFQKKGYDTRRFTFDVKRTKTQAEIIASAKKDAIKPAYTQLTKNLKAYTGRIMKYKMYVEDMQKAGEEWIITMAMAKNKTGNYTNRVVVITTEEPNFSLDSQQTMYGVCDGAYEITDGDSIKEIPCFQLLFWD